jgi:hypothetical protein
LLKGNDREFAIVQTWFGRIGSARREDLSSSRMLSFLRSSP